MQAGTNGCKKAITFSVDSVSAAASVGPGRSPPSCRPPRHAPQAGLRAHLVAKPYRTLTKKSGTANAIPDFFGRGRRTRTLGRCGNKPREAGKGRCCPVLPNKSQKSGAGLVLRGNFPGQNGQKRAGNPRKNGKCIDENRYGPYNKKCWSNNPRVKALCYADMVGHCFYGGIV